MISHEGQNALKMHFTQELVLDDFSCGAGLNLVFPESKRPPGLSLIEFRYTQYDNGLWGVRFGRLANETYGYGLIMDSYDSAPVSTYFNMNNAGFKAYTRQFLPVGIYSMFAGTGVVGTRLTYDLFKMPGLDTPLIAGVSYVSETDGVVSGNAKINKGVSAYSVDMGFKLIQPWMDAYLEYGSLSNQSNALALGTKMDFGEIFDVRAEYRMLGKNFVPGFFNSSYEVAPIDISNYSASAMNGYFVGAELSVMPFGIVSVGYEDYDNADAVFKGALALNDINGFSGVLSYQQILLRPDIPYKVSGTLTYPLNAYTSSVIYYEKIGDNDESYSVAYKMNF